MLRATHGHWLLALTLVGCVPRQRDGASSEQDGGPRASASEVVRAGTTGGARGSRGDAGRRAVRPGAPRPAMLRQPFKEGFERAELGPDWYATSPVWRIQSGQLCGEGARNRPVWLRRGLPTNARIEFDAVSRSPDGDLKVEVWGDGKSSARGTSYDDATSYVVIFGGWKNRYHVIARQDEHAKDRMELAVDDSGDDPRAAPVQPNQTYRFTIERRDGKTLRWLVDDVEILRLSDDAPLVGEGHEHFGFNDWAVPVCFDNLEITPLPG